MSVKKNHKICNFESTLTLKHAGGSCGKTSGTDMACIPSIFIKTSQIYFGESCLTSALGGAKRGHLFFNCHILAKKNMLSKAKKTKDHSPKKIRKF